MLSAIRTRVSPTLLRRVGTPLTQRCLAVSTPTRRLRTTAAAATQDDRQQPAQQQQQESTQMQTTPQGQQQGGPGTAVQRGAGAGQRGELAMPSSFRRLGDTLSQVQREMDMLTNHFFGEDLLRPFFDRGFGGFGAFPTPSALPDVKVAGFAPLLPFDVEETDKAYVISAEVPGFSKEAIKCMLSPEGILTVQGEQQQQEEDKRRKASRYASFSRSFRLPSNVSTEGIRAEVKHGVLMVEVPKVEKTQVQNKEIPIQG